jgi:hypothetical protein
MPGRCDNASVGILISDDRGRHLMFDRNTLPDGCAGRRARVRRPRQLPQCRVCRSRRGTRAQRRASHAAAGRGWRNNLCNRGPGRLGTGHQWRIYQAAVSGELNPSPRETRNVRWLSPTEIQRLAERTAAHAHGRIAAGEFAAAPGIEPVWAAFLADLHLITMGGADLEAIERVACFGPDTGPPVADHVSR